MQLNERFPVTRLPRLTKENLDAVMAERLAETETAATSIPMLWQGFLEMEITTPTGPRTAKLYIPKDTPQGTAFAFLNLPAGQEALPFLWECGWIDCADRCQLPLFLAEPGEGGWKSPEVEQPYIEACVQAMFAGVYLRAGMSIYVVGYGDIGRCLHRWALDTPLRTAAAVFLDASALTGSTIAQAEAARLDGDGMRFDLLKKRIPVPVWIIEREKSARTEKVIAHWRQPLAASEAQDDPELGTVYFQENVNVCTPDGPIACLCVKETDAIRTAPKMTQSICHFLRHYARYNKFGPCGNALVPYVDYARQGIEVRHYPDADGKLRECLVYVPKAYRGKGKLPLLFAIHGSSESVRNYMEESLLYRLADEKGFIVAMPETRLYQLPDSLTGGAPIAWRPRWESCSGWGMESASCAANDLRYFESVLDALVAEYPVDEKRIYGTGHSNGFMMMSFLASTPCGSRFAAVAMTSGVTTVWDETGTAPVPVWMTMGEYDLWPYALTEESGLTAGIDLWLTRNGLADKDGAKEKRVSGADECYTDGRHHVTVWRDAHGDPRVRYDWIEKKDHMNTAEENRRFWDEWFSRWTFNDEGQRIWKK